MRIESEASNPQPSSQKARALLERLFATLRDKRFAVRLWDGQEVSWSPQPDFTLVFMDPGTFSRCMLTSDPSDLASAYVDGQLEVEGNLDAAIGLASYLRALDLPLRDKLRFAPRLLQAVRRRSRTEDARDVRAHYDLSDEFFSLFLDDKMVYSCAYFAPGDSLEGAQERKLDLVCRKLDLQPGERLLDIGCGWGAQLLWAARHYGIRGTGITLSRNQSNTARRRVAEAGLGDRIEIREQHYLELPRLAFDKICSVGMYEHVGVARYPEYFASVLGALRPGGLFLNHGITRARRPSERSGGDFILDRVFPGAELDDISHTLGVIEDTGFEIVDLQALRPHYAMTLREWARRFTANRNRAAALVPGRVLRMWDLYLPGCAHAFDEGLVGVHQVLAAKPDSEASWQLPLTREALLPGAGSPGASRSAHPAA